MDEHDFSTWVNALQTYFPRFNILPNEEAIELWYRELGDIPYVLLSTALHKWVQTEKWPPTIAELRALCAEIVNGKPMDWGEGWAEVRRAIGRYGYMRQEEALKSMSPVTRRAVQRIGWTDICMSENADVIRAQFRQAFEACIRREAEDRNLSPELKADIQHIQLGQGERPQLTKGDYHEKS